MEYLEDASGFVGQAERILTPHTPEEAVDTLAEAVRLRVPITAVGGKTGITGGAMPLGGWALSLEKLNRLEIAKGRALVGSGVHLQDLQAAARATGQIYAPDPTETTASLGGTIATNASGSRSFCYGATRDHVLALKVALMDGRVLTVRRGEPIDFPVPAIRLPRTTKVSAGLQLAPGMGWIDLFVGSEGILGIVLEAELRLLPAPKELVAGVVFFAAGEAALDAVEAWRPVKGLRMLEYFDRASIEMVEAHATAEAVLLIEHEVNGDDALDRWLDRLQTSGALLDDCWFATSARDFERFRELRHALPEKVNQTIRQNGFMKVNSDYAVPIARNREMMDTYRRVLDETFPGQYVVFGHIGDAHVHTNILPKTQEQFERAQHVMLELARQAVALGGTVAAEHGLGKRKTHLLGLQYPAESIQAMRDVKSRLDPHWLLGRGTLIP